MSAGNLRLADRSATFGGSGTFSVLFAVFPTVWIGVNEMAAGIAVDQPPFILLNWMLSCLSVVQAPIVPMGRNRQTARDRQEALPDFAIHFRAEQESRELRRRPNGWRGGGAAGAGCFKQRARRVIHDMANRPASLDRKGCCLCWAGRWCF